MTAAELTGAPDRTGLRIPPLFWLSLAAITIISLPNLRDPMIRHDDFPALLGHADLFWNKTLHEGRWLNYIWHLRGAVTPAWLNFALYQICWAVFATTLALAATRQDRALGASALMAALILVAPPATLISLWFNTLLPGLALVALYGAVTCLCTQRTARALLPVFTVATFMAYTTYPLLLLALCLAATERRSLRDLAGLLLLFGASFLTAVLVTYTLNWQVHGVFGVPLADWRNAEPAEGLTGLWANREWIWASFAPTFDRISLGSPLFLLAQGACLAGSIWIMTRRAPMELTYLCAGLATGLALVVLQATKLGVFVPTRAMIFAWAFCAVIVVRGAQLLDTGARPLGRLGLLAALVLILAHGVAVQNRYAAFHYWQAQTRVAAAELAALPGPVHVIGDVMESLAGRSASIQSDAALRFRIEQITGHQVILCAAAGVTCAPAPPATSDWQVIRSGDRTLLILPNLPTGSPGPTSES